MNLHRALPSALVIVATLVCAGFIIQAAELEGSALSYAGIAALIASGLVTGALFGEKVYAGIKGLVIVTELFVAFLIVVFTLAAADTREELENAEGLEGLGGTLAFIILIAIIIILIAVGIGLLILAFIVAIGGWIGIKIHSKFVPQPSSYGRYRSPPRKSR
ncbi:MAG: hypothetical protein ACE5OZ_04670 [Candidatus Heimdallarchaeota archaeon]